MLGSPYFAFDVSEFLFQLRLLSPHEKGNLHAAPKTAAAHSRDVFPRRRFVDTGARLWATAR